LQRIDTRLINNYYGSGHLHQLNLDGQVISDMERDDLHGEVYRTQGKLTSCIGYDAMTRWGARRGSSRRHCPLTSSPMCITLASTRHC